MTINSAELTDFARSGYLVLPGFLSESQRAALRAEADRYGEAWGDENNHQARPCAMDYEACTRLATEPRLMLCLRDHGRTVRPTPPPCCPTPSR